MGSTALIVAPAVIARVPAAAAKWKAVRDATYGKVAARLGRLTRVGQPVAKAVGQLREVVRAGYELTNRELASIYGVSSHEAVRLARVARELKITIVLRSRASESIAFLQRGLATVKPCWIETKDVTWADVKYLGYEEGEVGSVVMRKPRSLNEVKIQLRKDGYAKDSAFSDEVVDRHKTRVKESAGEYETMKRWDKAGEVRGKWPWAENGVDRGSSSRATST